MHAVHFRTPHFLKSHFNIIRQCKSPSGLFLSDFRTKNVYDLLLSHGYYTSRPPTPFDWTRWAGHAARPDKIEVQTYKLSVTLQLSQYRIILL